MDKSTRITEAQVTLLSFCFNQLKAELWDAKELKERGYKKKRFQFILDTDKDTDAKVLSGLNIKQLHYQHVKFLSDYFLRNKYGRKLYKLTKTLVEDESDLRFGNIFTTGILLI